MVDIANMAVITMKNQKPFTRCRRCQNVVCLLLFCLSIAVTEKDRRFDSIGSPLDFFNKSDALHIKWYHGANSKEKMMEALKGNYMMLEGDIQMGYTDTDNDTERPIMAHPPDFYSDNTLDNWLNNIFNKSDKGAKLDFKSVTVMEPSLKILQSKQDRVRHPVWANADIVRGPGTDELDDPPLDHTRFLDLVNQYFPRMTLSLGWTTGCCEEAFTEEMMKKMWNICRNIPHPVSFPARAALFKRSWPHFKWLLGKDQSRFSITVWTPAGSLDFEGADIYDLLYVRNDCDKRLIYYDLPGDKFKQFKQLALTAGSLFNYFPLKDRDGLKITWAHAANNKSEMEKALKSDVMMLEADVLLRGQWTENQTDIPVMAHPPATDSDNTLENWISSVIKTDKGMKVDFKYISVVEPAMKIFQKKKHEIHQPVWINADIFIGPNALFSFPVNATEFKRLVLKYFPECTLSIGWTTGWDNEGDNEYYTSKMVEKMADFCEDIKQPITFPVRAALVKNSWNHLSNLLNKSRAYSLTIWSSKNDKVDPNDMVFVRKNSEIDRVYFDLPEPLMSEFLKKLNETSQLTHVHSVSVTPALHRTVLVFSFVLLIVNFLFSFH